MSRSTDQELLDLQATLYTSRNPTRRWLHSARREWIERQIRSLAPRDRALEVGPGSGVYLPLLAASAREVVAADIEDAYLEQARLATQHFNLRCVRDDITRTNLAEGGFDLILCTEVIEHIHDSEAALRGLKRLLAAHGKIILSTPQRYSPLELTAKIAFLPGIVQIVKRIYGEPVLEMGHVNLLTESQARRQFQRAGLRATESFKTGMYLPVIAEVGGEFALRVERKLEAALRSGPLSWLLWTQCYVLEHAEQDV